MANIKNQHVVPRKKSWAVKHEDAEKASKIFENKNDAIEYARNMAKKNDACVVLHDKKAKIEEFTS
ncbi:DUF2188 domain-containing protein [Candidatus Pacearchaeota archaeon]|nr:DUF2188 domain-containing protein [Candidatus Pacearchaeota archaeon]